MRTTRRWRLSVRVDRRPQVHVWRSAEQQLSIRTFVKVAHGERARSRNSVATAAPSGANDVHLSPVDVHRRMRAQRTRRLAKCGHLCPIHTSGASSRCFGHRLHMEPLPLRQVVRGAHRASHLAGGAGGANLGLQVIHAPNDGAQASFLGTGGLTRCRSCPGHWQCV